MNNKRHKLKLYDKISIFLVREGAKNIILKHIKRKFLLTKKEVEEAEKAIIDYLRDYNI